MLCDRDWKLKYTPDDGNLVRLFYIPALEDAERYDRLTGYFNANALRLAARGIEGLVRNDGRMRLIVGCTLDPPEIKAIEKGEQTPPARRAAYGQPASGAPGPANVGRSRTAGVDGRTRLPGRPGGGSLRYQPVAHPGRRHLSRKGGYYPGSCWRPPCVERQPQRDGRGWQHNWESINVYTSWGTDAGQGK